MPTTRSCSRTWRRTSRSSWFDLPPTTNHLPIKKPGHPRGGRAFLRYWRLLLLRLRRPFGAEFDDTDRVDRTVGRWNGHAAFSHQLADEGCGFRTGNSRLHPGADEAVSVIQRLPGVTGEER